MKYAIEYLKHHKINLQRMVDDGTELEADRDWYAKLVAELDAAIQCLNSQS